MAKANIGRKFIGEILVDEGIIQQEDLDKALELAKSSGKKVGKVLTDMGLTDDQAIASALAHQLSIPLIDLRGIRISSEVLDRVPSSFARNYLVLPIAVAPDRLTLTMANPLDVYALEDVRFASQLPIEIAVSPEQQLVDAISRLYLDDDDINHSSLSSEQVQSGLEVLPGRQSSKDDTDKLDDLLNLSDKPPIIKFTNSIFIDAIRQNASDIHIEPRQGSVLIRYRVDGIVKEVMQTERHVHSGVLTRIKVLSNLDISERRKPQDGKFKVKFKNEPIDLRVSTLPTAYGEKITIRILNSSAGPSSLEGLGMGDQPLEGLKKAISKPQGIVLVTGPTGSGKSTTLYSCIRSLHKPEVNIVTLENPIEYELEGVNQVEINPKQGLTFAEGLRSILRQDPDIVLLGEIRDEETAEVAFHAAQTGHLVLSTLHTNSALATLSRLRDLNIDAATLANGINAVVSQRLVRKLCDKCKQPEDENESNGHDDATYWQAAGCESCEFTGYSGRLGIHEILTVSASLKSAILAKKDNDTLEKLAIKSGMQFLHHDGLDKARQGLTTLSEVYRVAPPPDDEVIESDDSSSEAVEVDDAAIEESMRVARAATTAAVETVKPRKVIVSAKQEFMRHFLRGVMEGQGCVVQTYSQGGEALKKTLTEVPDMLIVGTDIVDIDVFEMVKKLRAKLSTSYIPVVVIGEDDSIEHEMLSFRAGADEYLHKPVNTMKLLARIDRLLRRQSAA